MEAATPSPEPTPESQPVIQSPAPEPSNDTLALISEAMDELSRGYGALEADSETSKLGTVVILGNDAPLQQIHVRDQDGAITQSIAVPHPTLNQSTTRVEMWPGFDDPEFVERSLSTDNDRMLSMIARGLSDDERKYAVGLLELEQVMAAHSGISKPAYVVSSDAAFARTIGKHFNCPVGEPTALLTSGGRDALHAQNYSTSAPPATFNYIALTASTTAPAATDTTLTGEITTTGGGLIRAQATYAHTAGTNTTTLTKTFTANGSDALPVTVAQIGVFNASTAGTLAYHTALNATATLTTSGDNVTVTETITEG
jgi:hypothetical protein